jgi:hypothetical protein
VPDRHRPGQEPPDLKSGPISSVYVREERETKTAASRQMVPDWDLYI